MFAVVTRRVCAVDPGTQHAVRGSMQTTPEIQASLAARELVHAPIVARALGIHLRSVYRWIERGHVEAKREGGRVLLTLASVRARLSGKGWAALSAELDRLAAAAGEKASPGSPAAAGASAPSIPPP